LVSVIAVGLAVCAGRTITTPAPPAAAAIPTPQDPRTISLQKADLPSSLVQCPASGEISSYLHLLQAGGSPSYEVTANQWSSLRGRGAQAGWVSSFTTDPFDCDARLGERKSPSATSFTFRFSGPNQATDAFKAGFLGLNPAPDLSAPGLVQGDATKLGPQSWVYDQNQQTPNVWVAYWARQDLVLFLFTEHLTPMAARLAATGMDGRVH